jgi:hypothetical protein
MTAAPNQDLRRSDFRPPGKVKKQLAFIRVSLNNRPIQKEQRGRS